MSKPHNIGGRVVAQLVEELLSSDLSVRIAVTGSSMTPTLESGDVVTVSPVPTGQLHLGDLVLFRNKESKLVLHRLVRRLEAGTRRWQTRGDASPQLDVPIDEQYILGRVCTLERDGRLTRIGGFVSRLRGYTIVFNNLLLSWFYYRRLN